MNTLYEDRLQESTIFLVLSFIFMICSPLLALLYIIYGIYRQYVGSVYVFSLFLGIFAYLIVPFQDIYRQMINYYYWQGKAISDIDILDLQLNGIIVYLYQFMVNNDIPYDFIRLVEIPVAFSLLYSIFKYKIKESPTLYTYHDINVRLFVLFLFFDLLYTASGVRFGFSLCVYLYGLHLIFDKNQKVKSFFFLAFAACFHSAFIMLGLLSFFIYKAKISFKRVVLVALLCSILVNVFLSTFGAQLLGARMDWYFSSKSNVASYSKMTLIGFTVFWLQKLCALPFAFILFKYNNSNSKWCKMALVWLTLSLVFVSNAVFFYRIWWVFMAIGIYMFLDIEREYFFSTAQIRRLVVCGLMFCFFNLINYHSMLARYPFMSLCKPVPYILAHHYSKQEVFKIVKENGSYKQ